LGKIRELFPYIYAMISTELAKLVKFPDQGAASLVPSTHYQWGKGVVDHDKQTNGLQNVLLNKILYS